MLRKNGKPERRVHYCFARKQPEESLIDGLEKKTPQIDTQLTDTWPQQIGLAARFRKSTRPQALRKTKYLIDGTAYAPFGSFRVSADTLRKADSQQR